MPSSLTLDRLAKSAIVGKGMTAEVYALDTERVLKLFHSEKAHSRAEHEFKVSRAVHAAGIPAPATYELIDLGNRPGIIFERVDGPSLFKQVQRRPWKLFAAVHQLAQLHATIHDHAAPPELPSQRDWIAGRIQASSALTAPEKDRLQSCVNALPEGSSICHGDFHPDNVLITSRGPIIIDWSSATCGHPLGDVAMTSHLIQTADLPSWASWHAQLLLRMSRTFIHRAYLNTYLQLRPANRQDINAWQIPIAASANARHAELHRSAKKTPPHSQTPIP